MTLRDLPENKIILLLAGITLLTRLLFMWYIPLSTYNYWEYGEIARNLSEGRGYSLFYMLDGKIDIYYHPQAHPFPSAYVPPAYVFFLYPFMGIYSDVLRNVWILLIQNLAAVLCCVLLFRLTKKLFDPITAIVAALAFALMPEMIFASNSFGPTVFYHAVVLGILLLLSREEKWSAPLLGLLFAAGIYLRPEMAVFLFLITLYFTFRKKIMKASVMLLVCMLLMLPWQLRNYRIFGQFIPLSTSSGLNLYRGHNADGIGSWGWEKNVYTHAEELSRDEKFEARLSSMYRNEAVKYIQAHPFETLKNSGKKLFHLWIFMPGDGRTSNLLYILPWLCMLGFVLAGYSYAGKRDDLQAIFLFLLGSSLVAILFFALPRYQTLMKIVLFPIAAYGFVMLAKMFRPEKTDQ